MSTPILNTADPTALDRTALPAQLLRIRTGIRAVLTLAVGASIAANVLHAQPTLVGRAIAAWSPLALLLTVELISRVPVGRRWLSAARMAATATIAGIAAWVSYWHMVDVAIRYGEAPPSAHLLPLSVDGLVVVASISLVEIAGRLRAAGERAPALAPPAAAEPAGLLDAGAETRGVIPVPVMEPAPTPAARAQRPEPAPVKSKGGRPAGSTVTGTVVTRLRDKHPDWTVAQIATKAGVSPRTARRHLNASTSATSPAGAPTTAPAPDPTPVPPAASEDLAA